MDGFRIATEFEKWAGVWLIFDEDDDDNRWEEMFSRHEEGWEGYADRIGDRTEIDRDYAGKGSLYVGRFDGRIHLFHAEEAFWDIDYHGWYKGSMDREGTDEGPLPPRGLRYPRVRYRDRSGNGFIDTVEYLTVEFGDEDRTAVVHRTVDLNAFADEDLPEPDRCPLFDPRGDAPLSGWRLRDWDGKPLTLDDFRNTPNHEVYRRMHGLYGEVCERMWTDARLLYETARRHALSRSRDLDRAPPPVPGREQLAGLVELVVPPGYSRHLQGNTRREKYHNGFWLREKVYQDVREYSGLPAERLDRLYYTGRIRALCELLDAELKP
jgi:hypothetical protein